MNDAVQRDGGEGAGPKASLLIIGNEILSGRTQDTNLAYIAEKLGSIGVTLAEARVVADSEAEIIEALNALKVKYDYVFTTGGIGPTHDDITAACVAKAVGKPLTHHPEAMDRLSAHYKRQGGEFNTMRQRMAMTPEGAALIDNPVSTAPGFIAENIYVMAGVPRVMQAMLDGLLPNLKGGAVTVSKTIRCSLGEGVIAEPLAAIQSAHATVELGSYPGYAASGFSTQIVLRSKDERALDAAKTAVIEMVSRLGGEPEPL